MKQREFCIVEYKSGNRFVYEAESLDELKKDMFTPKEIIHVREVDPEPVVRDEVAKSLIELAKDLIRNDVSINSFHTAVQTFLNASRIIITDEKKPSELQEMLDKFKSVFGGTIRTYQGKVIYLELIPLLQKIIDRLEKK